MRVLSVTSDYSVTTQDEGAVLLVDATNSDITITLPYARSIDGFTVKRIDASTYNILLRAIGNDLIEETNGTYIIDGGFDSAKIVSNRDAKWYCILSYNDSDSPTIHFDNQQDLGNLTLATAGALTGAIAARYGQLNIHKNCTIESIHVHQMMAGNSGNTTIEFYRKRDGIFTCLGTGSVPHTSGDFATRSVMFLSESYKKLKKGDYLFMQPIEKQTGASADGLTCDIHLSGSRSE